MHDIRENKQEMQRLIQAMGNALAAMLPEGWEKAVVGYFIAGEKGISHLQIHAFLASAEEYIDIVEAAWDDDDLDDGIIEVRQLCGELRSLCAAANDRWNAMTFCLQCNGTFNMDYSYEVINEYDSAYVLQWQSRYLD